jgi:phage terminase Nu1 subunit (DNA packaging protein)
MGKGLEVNRSDLAKLFGVSLPTIDSWVSNGCPYIKAPDGKNNKNWLFDSAEVHRWLKDRDIKQVQDQLSNAHDLLSFDEARKRKMQAEAGLMELELREKKGQLLDAELIQKAGVDVITACKTKIRALAVKLPPILAPITDVKQIQDRLEKGIDDALNELADFRFFNPEQTGDADTGMA